MKQRETLPNPLGWNLLSALISCKNVTDDINVIVPVHPPSGLPHLLPPPELVSLPAGIMVLLSGSQGCCILFCLISLCVML